MDPNEIIQTRLLGIDGEFPTIQEMKIQFPEFPLWWLDKAKRNMEGLREIASHLHGKTETLRMSRGIRGEATEIEKQIIFEMSELKQATLHMTDALESLIQITVKEYESRPSQRIKWAFATGWRKTKSYGNLLWNNPMFKVCGGLSTIAFICTMIVWTARHFGWLH
jgi:hypothetical protein